MKLYTSIFARIYKRFLADTAGQRLRATPSYFFLIWRWSMWLYALVLIVGSREPYTKYPAYGISVVLLFVTLLQTLIVTLYSPVARHFFPRLRLPFASPPRSVIDEEEPIPTALARLRNPYSNLILYGIDLLVCGLVTYLSGPFALHPYFGTSSPFYRYGISTAFAAALAYGYRGGLGAALGYDLFIVLGILFRPTYADPLYTPNVIDVVGSLVDTPVAALVAALIISLLDRYVRSLQSEQANVRQQKAQLDLGNVLIQAAYERQHLLTKSAEQLRQGGRFESLALALVPHTPELDTDMADTEVPRPQRLEIYTSTAHLPHEGEASLPGELFEQVRQTGERLTRIEPPVPHLYPPRFPHQLYLPFAKQGEVQLILGVESHRPIDEKQEDFLVIAGTQLLTALENIRLTEQTILLTAQEERNRIAREIHDGVAQLIYILKISAETCIAYTQRLMEASEEEAEQLNPLEERLQKLVTISKQALWETRSYMFSLKPLNQEHLSLQDIIQGQLREFETISEVPTSLYVEGEETSTDGDNEYARQRERVYAAFFRIVQEALTNAYKHAEATRIEVALRQGPEDILVEIGDNGKGLPGPARSDTRFYSGHGLTGMHERATELGGTLDILPGQAGGLLVRAWIPLSHAKTNTALAANASELKFSERH
ncbi:sensor histidine kinase [Ktedonobacter robiniae]|uniref:histidine kinase n=1 Tax=Ktedonobacter robiniae TaxID=2778365 RepID=A0ABQ3UI22_9CHLR|nr:sensor histidine kinase [Ktedonobacter robiniae]GHO52359.1 hypothetical protein KSB_08340 [Ktedonobacter robiniae]